MNYIARNYSPTRMMLLFVMLGMLAACAGEKNMANGMAEEITVKLRAGTRATGDDALIRNDDDRFGSLIVYAFGEKGEFLARYPFTPEGGTVNTYVTPAFNCGINVKKLLAIANYAAYEDLKEQLKEGLPEAAVKAIVANAEGKTALGAGNILMTGEATGFTFKEGIGEDEHIVVDLSLKRLAARVDVFVFKTPGWDADVKVTKVEFYGSVKNTTLKYEAGKVDLPGTPEFDAVNTFTPEAGDTPSLETFEGDNALLWQLDEFLRGRFYTYRTVQEQTSDNVPALAVTVKVDDNIEKTYTAAIAGKDDAGKVTLDAGNVYQVCAILTKAGLVIEMQVADWEQAPEYNLNFDYPTYENPLKPWGATVEQPYEQPTVFYNPDGNSLEGTFRFSFTLTGPDKQAWQATLLDATTDDFTVEVYQDGNRIDNPTASPQPFEIRVKALKSGNVGNTVKLGIAFTPVWDPQSSSLLMINGHSDALPWKGSTDPTIIVIEQTERPTD